MHFINFLQLRPKEHLTEQIQILQGKISCLEDVINTQEEVGENMGPIMEREQMGLLQLKLASAELDQYIETQAAEPPSPFSPKQNGDAASPQ
ncbi:hypothetical protein JOQ06_023794, partial [Pogonophryne albipinna]